MNRKKQMMTLLVSVALFAGAVLGAGMLSRKPADSGEKYSPIVLSEILPSNQTYPAPNGEYLDFIEVTNISPDPVDISGYMLSDDAESVGYTFPKGTVLQPGEFALCWCDKKSESADYGKFGISKDGGETILLYNSANVVIDQLELPGTNSNESLVRREDGSWSTMTVASPGYPNTQEGYEAWLSGQKYDAPDIVISEVMPANRSTLRSEKGFICDWVELYNTGDAPVELGEMFLSDDPADRGKWQLPAKALNPGEYLVIPCAGSHASDSEADFALPRDSFTMVLAGKVGNVIHQLDVPRMDADHTYARQPDGTYQETAFASPGYENTEAGSNAYRSTQTVTGDLIITEAMASNSTYLRQPDGKCYDWVELTNVSAGSIDLADYSLSNDPGEPQKFQLPAQTLAPGESIVILCSGQPELTGAYQHAPFSLSRKESWVYLSARSTGQCLDFLRIYDVPNEHSVGRMSGENGTYYFTIPTPGAPNGTGVAFISATPQVGTPDGVYNDVTGVEVALQGKGKIRYTLDGSLPTASSAVYTKPLNLTETTVVRMAAYEEGKLPSDIVTAAYIINENHTLPVISIAANPGDLFGPSGIYTNFTSNREVPCNLKLFENGKSFTIDCGVKLYGHTGLKAPKKSFKVNFRGKYGETMLSYPVYGEDGPQNFTSLCIRAGQDYPTTIFRDELFTNLCRQMSDKVLAQRDKFSILYVNGEYFGIYCMKEAFNEQFYVENMGGSAENVTIVQAPVGMSSEIFELLTYCRKNDLSDSSNYAYISTKIDIDSIIDWMIMEGYSTNGDVQQNLRYFKSKDTGDKYQFAFYDLDWSWYYHNGFKHVLSPHQSWQHMGFTKNLMKNPEFRQKFLQRTSECMATTLSNENVLSVIDSYENLLEPEVKRERKRWGSSYEAWKNKVDSMRKFITEYDHLGDMVYKLEQYIGLTAAEKQQYFERWS